MSNGSLSFIFRDRILYRKGDEAARKPWPASEKEALAWRFNPDAQAWTKP